MNEALPTRLPVGDHERLAVNLSEVGERLAHACARRGREARSVRIVAAVKYGGAALVGSLAELGLRDLGVNRVDHLEAVASRLAGSVAPRWHMLGHLQRNKLKRLRAPISMLHSLDSLALARALASRPGSRVALLVQVNTSREPQKSGVEPEALGETLDALAKLEGVELAGLMTMAARGGGASARSCFRLLASLREEQRGRGHDGLAELSMGMSGDFEEAVEEGATLIRLGRILYRGVEALERDLAAVGVGR